MGHHLVQYIPQYTKAGFRTCYDTYSLQPCSFNMQYIIIASSEHGIRLHELHGWDLDPGKDKLRARRSKTDQDK